MSNENRMLGDKINMVAESIADNFKLSKCEAMSITAQILLDEGLVDKIKLTVDEQKIIKGFVLASCLNDNDYIFKS